ncbi:hypothetical protein DRH27_00970 [Candidatus Falkowbacteria bacterium]|nr:MAG: hypothetical protein DRH27_00970 [Candidatus Falkowbacteria bacterium]
MQFYLIIFFFSLFFSVVFTVLIKKLAIKFKIVDKPEGIRKIHKKKIPLLGGIAIFLAFFIMVFLVKDRLTMGDLEISHWLGFFLGALVLMIGGFWDDKYNLKAKYQIIFPLLAVFLVIAGGVGIEKITNPLGGYLYLDNFKILIYGAGNTAHYFTVISDIFLLVWLMGMMYTTKLLDGIDGLVTGVTAIGGIIIFLFTMTTRYFQPDIGLAALILAGACAGFLIFNFHPAKIFLGDGGSLLLGYILGVLAIISGGKIAIALLVMGLPIMDVVWTILRRLKQGINPFKFSDRKHLHFRLLDLGIGQRKTVLIYYGFSVLFGLSALFLQSLGKLFALGLLMAVMLFIVVGFSYLDKKRIKNYE